MFGCGRRPMMVSGGITMTLGLGGMFSLMGIGGRNGGRKGISNSPLGNPVEGERDSGLKLNAIPL
jgi:hypothetical protein